MILCAAAHDLCGDGIALCSGTAEHNRYLSFVACDGVQHLPMQTLFRA